MLWLIFFKRFLPVGPVTNRSSSLKNRKADGSISQKTYLVGWNPSTRWRSCAFHWYFKANLVISDMHHRKWPKGRVKSMETSNFLLASQSRIIKLYIWSRIWIFPLVLKNLAPGQPIQSLILTNLTNRLLYQPGLVVRRGWSD